MQICLETRKSFFIEKTLQNIATWIHGIDLSRELGLKYPKAICVDFQVCLNVFQPRSQESQVKKNQNRFAPNKFQFPLGFLISEGKASLLGAIKTWPGSWDPKRTVMAPPYWDGGAGFSVKRLPVYQRWHLIALHSPSLPLAKLSKTGQPTRAAENADDELSSASELRSTLDWFNELMRRRPAELFLIRLMVHTWYLSSFFQPDLTCQTILMNSQFT